MKSRNDELFLYDILESCKNIAMFVDGVDEETFKNNKMLQDALVRNIEVIGEASKNLSSEIRDNSPQIAWRDIVRMRDKVVHHYFRIDLDVVWLTVARDIPLFYKEVEKIYSKLPAS